MDFWIQPGSPQVLQVPGVVDGLDDAMRKMYPVDTERLILCWNGVPVPLVYAEDVHVMVDDIAVMLERLARGTGERFRVRWGPHAFQVEWWIERRGEDLVIDSHWDVGYGLAEPLNARGRLVVPAEHFRREWLKVLRRIVDDVTTHHVAIGNTVVLDMVTAVLDAGPGPLPAPPPPGPVAFRMLPDDDDDDGDDDDDDDGDGDGDGDGDEGVGPVVLWTADAGTARLFTGQAALLTRELTVESGIGPDAVIDPDQLREFCEHALERYGRPRDGQCAGPSLTAGFLSAALELLRRAGHIV